jgi:Resolvase, N terminal domain
MNAEVHQKVTASHLKRSAYLYVRQSTVRQVLENTESTERQYALRQRAIALGWPSESVIVIDSDLGHSGASSADREGFQKLVAEVGMGHAGIVLGLEVSRLARNSTDWHRLLEICALSDTLILDEDGIYDPAHFNDRLLLGLKGTMSEAELHVLRARLRGGLPTRPAGESCAAICPWASSMTRRAGSFSILTSKSRRACACSSRPSLAPAQPTPRSSTSARRVCSFPRVWTAVRGKARSPGRL